MEGLKWGFETKKFGKPNLNSKNRIFEMFSNKRESKEKGVLL